jgi:peptidoglycan/LPS O-acetylase OafA/YrhL
MRLCLAVAAGSFLLRVIVVGSGAWPTIAYLITPCRLDGLLAGSFVALARRDRADWARLQRWAGRLVLGLGCLLVGIAVGQGHFTVCGERPDQSIGLTVGIGALAVFFSGLIVMAVSAPKTSRIRILLENGWLRSIGKYSYAMYVFHILIQHVTLSLVSPLSYVPALVAKAAVVFWMIPASFGAAWLSYHLYEKHFLRLKRFFEYRVPAHAGALIPSKDAPYSYAKPDLLQTG